MCLCSIYKTWTNSFKKDIYFRLAILTVFLKEKVSFSLLWSWVGRLSGFETCKPNAIEKCLSSSFKRFHFPLQLHRRRYSWKQDIIALTAVEHTIHIRLSLSSYTEFPSSFTLCSSTDKRDLFLKTTNLKAVLEKFNQMWRLVNF